MYLTLEVTRVHFIYYIILKYLHSIQRIQTLISIQRIQPNLNANNEAEAENEGEEALPAFAAPTPGDKDEAAQSQQGRALARLPRR
jgi:hypothetical protein